MYPWHRRSASVPLVEQGTPSAAGNAACNSTKGCPAIEVDFSLPSERVVDILEQVAREPRYPDIPVVDNGPELRGRALDGWADDHGVRLFAYLAMFYRGVYGDYSVRLLNSPSYEGDRDLKTYPEYRDNTMGYINLAIEHAGDCKNLPFKKYFSKSSALLLHKGLCYV